jgi:hypothetical protein
LIKVAKQSKVAMKHIIRSISLFLLITWGVIQASAITPVSYETDAKTNTQSFSVYPNPIKDKATITLSITENKTVKVELFDITGKLVQKIDEKNLSAGTHEFELLTEDLKNGVYFCKVTAGDWSVAKRLIIKH